MLHARWTLVAALRLMAAGLAGLLGLALVGLSAAPAHAQGLSGAAPNIAAALEVEGPLAPGGETTLAIRFTPVSPEWHGYWSNPGDAGLGMQVEWDLPEGVSVGAFEYPTPGRLLIDGLMNHIFEGQYAVLAPLRLAADSTVEGPLRIAGTAFYLACTDEICVPEEAQIEALVVIGGSDSAPRDASFAQYRAAIPPLLDAPATFEQSRGLLRLAIPFPENANIGQPHLFLGEKDIINYSAPQGFSQVGDTLVAEIELAGTGEDPDTLSGILKMGAGGEDARGLRFNAVRGEVPSGGRTIMARDSTLPSVWLILLGAFAGGLLLNIMPCVFPILSLKALSLAKAGAGPTEARRDALAYTAGVMLATVALGAAMLALRAAGEQVGWAFQLQEPGVVVALFLLASLITANFAGVFELPSVPLTRGDKPASSFATGLLAAVAATPCTGPFMAAAIGAALLLPVSVALAVFAALGLGLALPFLLIGFVPALRTRLPRPGTWMGTFRKLLAIPMGLTALALAWLITQVGGHAMLLIAGLAGIAAVALAFVFHRRQIRALVWVASLGLVAALGVVRASDAAAEHDKQSAASLLSPRAFSQSALDEARATGQPVFVWFTADWCVTCKVNEGIAIEREATREAFDEAGVIAIVGDWTVRDAEITEFLTRQGAAGVPLYLWYPSGGAEAQQLPQVLTPDSLVNLARQSQARTPARLPDQPPPAE
ncbi:protein-disulfide reductase DsbD family protein [Qipengyuania sp. DSG2-2]|uniref:protein-disulfide reductase DsbD family protein n=1 Tax=Qipengyuania sp. DGS2-2 TaxID=3349631 RepID=UPI0036D38328